MKPTIWKSFLLLTIVLSLPACRTETTIPTEDFPFRTDIELHHEVRILYAAKGYFVADPKSVMVSIGKGRWLRLPPIFTPICASSDRERAMKTSVTDVLGMTWVFTAKNISFSCGRYSLSSITEDATIRFTKEGVIASGFEVRYTPLHHAVRQGDIATVMQLIKKGSDINSKNGDDQTTLHMAAKYGRHNIAKLLIDKGADAHTTDRWGATPLHVAAENGQSITMELLLANTKDINQPDNGGDTPLHIAASKGHFPIVELLMAANANKDIRNKDGKTALDKAEKKGHAQIVGYLQKQEVK